MSRRAVQQLGFGVLCMSLVAESLYYFRRRWIGRLLRLRTARYNDGVECNLRVPMPDGVQLMADHYFPQARGSFPTLLIRSGYGRGKEIPLGSGNTFYIQRFAERGYHVVIQTTRGMFDSGGEFEPFLDSRADGRATLDWLEQQPWFNGQLGMWGSSWGGWVQWAIADDPRVKSLTPSFITANLRDIVQPDGALALDTLLRWSYLVHQLRQVGQRWLFSILLAVSPPRQERAFKRAAHHLPICEVDAIAAGEPIPFFRRWLIEPPSDSHWDSANDRVRMSDVTASVHLISGWFDVMLRGLLADYAALKAAGKSPYLTIGPWTHLNARIGLEHLRETLNWFDAHLKSERGHLRVQPVRIYVMGAEEWRELPSWPPPAQEAYYYLNLNSTLSENVPPIHSPPDHYCYNPANATPAVGGPLLSVQAGRRDNRALETRPDVLCYTTVPLSHAIEVIGAVRLELYVQSSLAHTDFFGRLCDVYPDGRSLNVCDGLIRVEPGKGELQGDGTLRLEVDFWATAYRFERGHRIRLQVSSGAHPRWNRNLGTGEPLETSTRMHIADQTIYHDRAHPSALRLPVVSQM